MNISLFPEPLPSVGPLIRPIIRLLLPVYIVTDKTMPDFLRFPMESTISRNTIKS